MAQFLRIERDGFLARIVFTRDKGLNILASPVLQELKAEWDAIERSGARVCMGCALRMILSGQPLNDEQALRCGLITDTGDAGDLAARADALAKTLLTRGPGALALSKKLTRSALCVEQSAGMKAERYAFGN